MSKKYSKNFYIFLLCGCTLLYLIWALVIPFSKGPDEHMRYQIAQFIFEYGKLPKGDDERIRNATWGISYAFTPITSYIIGAFLMKIASLFSKDSHILLLAARLVSVFSSTGTVFFCMKISERLFKSSFKYVFVISVAVWPQFVFISSYVNNDAFGIFTVAWIIYAMLICEEKKWSVGSSVHLGVAIGVCLISYFNCYGIILVAFMYALISVISNKNIDNKFVFIVKRVLIVFFVAFIVAGWWFIRNALIYDGDFLGFRASHDCAEKYAADSFKPSNRQTPYQTHMPLKEMLFDKLWIFLSVRSFLGNFDYMNMPLDEWCYKVGFTILIVGILGAVFSKLINKNQNMMLEFKLKLSMIFMCIITIGLHFYYSYFNDFEPQGRYCLPMLVSIQLLVTYGWESIFNRKTKMITKIASALLVMAYLVISMYALFDVLIPNYN